MEANFLMNIKQMITTYLITFGWYNIQNFLNARKYNLSNWLHFFLYIYSPHWSSSDKLFLREITIYKCLEVFFNMDIYYMHKSAFSSKN